MQKITSIKRTTGKGPNTGYEITTDLQKINIIVDNIRFMAENPKKHRGEPVEIFAGIINGDGEPVNEREGGGLNYEIGKGIEKIMADGCEIDLSKPFKKEKIGKVILITTNDEFQITAYDTFNGWNEYSHITIFNE